MKQIIEHNPVVATVVTDKQGREIYGLVDEKGHSIRNSENKPTFAYKNERGEYCNEIDDQPVALPENSTFKKIEALSYISGIEKGSDGKFKLRTQKITGDHDQLAIGTRGERGDKINDKEITSTKGFSDDHGVAVTVALIAETEKTGAVRHGQDAGGAGTKGSLSQEDLNLIASVAMDKSLNVKEFLENNEVKALLDKKLSGNPHPEDFAQGNYAFYQPNGKISVAHNEAEIVEKYNEVEAQGFNIGINPRYGWQRNESGKLEIDPLKISAQDEKIASSRNQEEILKGPRFNHLPPEGRVSLAKSAKDSAEEIYELASLVSLVKLQEKSPSKDLALEVTLENLRIAEAQYLKEFQMVPPTVEAIIDKEERKKVMLELKDMKVNLASKEAELESRRRRVSDPELEVSGGSAPDVGDMKRRFSEGGKTSVPSATSMPNVAKKKQVKKDSPKVYNR